MFGRDKQSTNWLLIVFFFAVSMSSSVEAATNSLVASGDWNTPASWSLGTVPAGADTVLVITNNTVTANANPSSSYTGDLIIQSNATLNMGNMQITTCMPSATGKVFLYDGAMIQGQRFGYDGNTMTVSNDFILSGDSAFTRSSYNVKVFLTGIWSGTGGITFNCKTYATRANDTYNFAGSAPNTYTGGTILQSVSPGVNLDLFYANADGCFGTGDVTVNSHVELRLNGSTTDTIDDTATLFLNDDGTINLYGNNETVAGLVVDGATYPVGAYDSSRSFILGTGTLTVTNPVDNAAPTFVSITDDVSGGPVSDTNYLFNYIVSFNDDLVMDDLSLDSSDFTNAGNASIIIGDVTRLSATNFNVPVWIDSAGTVQLEIIQDTVITDVAGKPVDTTTAITDDTVITVEPYVFTIIDAGNVPTVDAYTNVAALSSPISVTFDASGSDKLVVVVTGENGNPGSLAGDCTAVTYDGTPLVNAVERDPIDSPPSPYVDQTYNEIWYLDNPGSFHSAGAIVATINSRGCLAAFGLSGTATGVGATAISPQQFKYVRLGTHYGKSIVIASHGMGGDGNTADPQNVNTVDPLVEDVAQQSKAPSAGTWDGHVVGHMPVESAGVVAPTFTGGYTIGSHTIAAEFGGLPPAGTVIMFR